MDTPYYVQDVTVTNGRGETHRIFRSGEGHVASAFTYGMARRLVEALNGIEAEKKTTAEIQPTQ